MRDGLGFGEGEAAYEEFGRFAEERVFVNVGGRDDCEFIASVEQQLTAARGAAGENECLSGHRLGSASARQGVKNRLFDGGFHGKTP
jgi:hypothetical protein